MIPATRLNEVERLIATRIVEDALQRGYVVSVNNGGDDNEISLSDDKEAILENMFAADQDQLTFATAKDYNVVGVVSLIYGNDGYDVMSDYTVDVHGAMTMLLSGASKLAHELEEQDARQKVG